MDVGGEFAPILDLKSGSLIHSTALESNYCPCCAPSHLLFPGDAVQGQLSGYSSYTLKIFGDSDFKHLRPDDNPHRLRIHRQWKKLYDWGRHGRYIHLRSGVHFSTLRVGFTGDATVYKVENIGEFEGKCFLRLDRSSDDPIVCHAVGVDPSERAQLMCQCAEPVANYAYDWRGVFVVPHVEEVE